MRAAAGASAGEASKPGRITMSVHGIRGTLVQCCGAWRLQNAAEVETLSALSDKGNVAGWFTASAAALNAGLIRDDGVRALKEVLSVSAEMEPPLRPLHWLSGPGLPAFAYACAHSDDPMLERWLSSFLRLRLAFNITPGRLWRDNDGAAAIRIGDGAFPIRHLGDNEHVDEELLLSAEALNEMPSCFWTHVTEHPKRWVREVVAASDPATTPATLRSLAGSEHPEVLAAVAVHPNVDADMLERIGCSRLLAEEISAMAALNLRASGDVLVRLAHVPSDIMSEAVACNPNAPAEALVYLARRSSKVGAVVCHPNTPVELLWELLRAPENLEDVDVPFNMTYRQNLPADLLTELLSHRSRFVRAGAVRRSDVPVDVLEPMAADRAQDVRRGVALRTGVSAAVLGVLANDAKVPVRAAAAANPGTPNSMLRSLAADEAEAAVRAGVASNPAAPPVVLAQLASDADPSVRLRVARNPNAPSEALAELASDASPECRAAVGANPSAPRTALRRLAADDEEDVRLRVAWNRSLPADVRAVLCNDSDYRVRLAFR